MDFTLVHGAYHGPWCWDRLIPELEKLGHRGVAVDLPIEDPASGADEYADSIAAVVARPDTIVVGHSMMGLAIPLVPDRVEVAGLAYLCAFVPVPGSSFNDVRRREAVEPSRRLQHVQFTEIGEDVWTIGPETALEIFFHDAPPGLASRSVRLLRPQCYRVMREISPLRSLPEVPSRYVLCRADRAVDPDWARAAARDRLGVVASEMDGGHSPFLTRPVELAAILDGMARELSSTDAQPG